MPQGAFTTYTALGCALAASALASLGFAMAPAASATIVKTTRIRIDTEGASLAARHFTLVYLDPALSGRRATGSATCVLERSVTRVLGRDRARRALAGTEVLTSSSGSLTLRWRAVQVRTAHGWGDLRGHWSTTAASGVYAGQFGLGELRATTAFKTTSYRGVLITAQ